MNDYQETRQHSWEDNSYRTGSTQPPKRRGGCILALVIAVILLGGIVTALGLLNIRLFQAANSREQEATVGFYQQTDPTETTVAAADTTGGQDVSLQLENAPAGLDNVPQRGGLSLQEIYKKAIDSVVSISSSAGTGTGVIVDAGGYVVTNYHVIEGGENLRVLLRDGRTVDAQVVGKDTISDLAVLLAEATDLTAATFGNSDSVRVGDAVVAIGDPLGIELRGTMTDGIISAINRDLTTDGRTMTLLQTNAALNSGNSGGPLLNCYGQVIGINVMKIGDSISSSSVEGLGFAIPSATVKEVVDQLIAQGYVSGRPSMGITGQALTTFDMLYYRLPQGIYITAVAPDSDAAAKGVTPGDILLALEGVSVYDADSFRSALYQHAAGDTVTVELYRSGHSYSLEITLDEGRS